MQEHRGIPATSVVGSLPLGEECFDISDFTLEVDFHVEYVDEFSRRTVIYRDMWMECTSRRGSPVIAARRRSVSVII